jgi:predicted  nucleic acid-binding Zn-ribbon protein
LTNRLATLFELQLIDDQLDLLEELRGDLPLAVNELNSQIKSIQVKIESREKEKEEALDKRSNNEEEVERLNKSLKKFKSQLYQVRNNKEYDALTKEIDHSEEKITKLTEENVELENRIEQIKIEIEDIAPQLDNLQIDVKEKEEELKKIIKANEREESKLKEKRENIAKGVRKSDYNTYARIRKACGGKAVVTISRSACTGCHNVVPPQRQLEVKSNKRLFTCESCGRLLLSPEIAAEAENNMK